MAIDTSIPLSAGGNSNILQTLLGATQLRGQIQSQKSNGALSRILQQSVDPVTGQPDMNKALSLAAQDPDAAYNLPAFQAQILNQKNNQLQYDKGKLELAQKRTDLLSAGFGGLLASGNITPQAVAQLGSQGIKAGLFTPEDFVSFTSDMPSDSGGLMSWARQKHVGFSQDSERLKTLMPQIQNINTGSQQLVAAFDPLTGAPTGQTTVINNQMSPEAASQPTQIYDPASGTMRTVTRDQFSRIAQGGGEGAPQGYVPDTSGGSLGTGRLTPIADAAPGVQAAPAAGVAEAAQVVGKGAAEASLSLQSQADAAPQAIYQFQNMREKLADINTGPGTDWRNTAAAFFTGISPEISARIGIDPQKIASAEEFKKYATQVTQATLASLGEGTDSKLASAAAANPGTQLSKLGNQQLLDVLIAGQRAIVAKNAAWQNSGLPPDQFNRFSTQWNKEVDPRIFTLQDMPREKAISMRDSLKPAEQKAFDASYNRAVQSGLIQRIGQ